MTAAPAAARVRLFFKAEGLKDTDSFSKSDPYAVFFENRSGRAVQLGRTETVSNNLNPVWNKYFDVDFRFEARQDFSVRLYDDDNKGPAGDDYLGTVSFQLAHVVSGRGSRITINLVDGPGKLTVASQPVANVGQDSIVLRFGGTKLKKMDMFGLSDPYFKLLRIQPNGTNVLLHQSKPIDNTLDPHWPPCPALQVSDLAGGNLDGRNLLFECWDEDAFSDDQMGRFTVSVNELIRAVGQAAPFTLKHATKEKTYGTIYVSQAQVLHQPTFPEFLAAGMQMNMAVAIDFTGSNGDPRNPQSLHFMNPTAPNQYVNTIMAVCDIVLEYDTDKLVPALGFGAQLPNGQVSHCFHLNAQPDPNVFGVQGILDSYGGALTAVRLAGPTNFAPTIRQAEQAARGSPNTYTILLIITDGAITDTDATVDAIVACGNAPMSIIIIGVGNADFSTMTMLDGDDAQLIDSQRRPCPRDLVQFVPFRDFATAPREMLAAEVLREVPRQVEEWARICGVRPDQFKPPSVAAAPPQAAAAMSEAPVKQQPDVPSPAPPKTV